MGNRRLLAVASLLAACCSLSLLRFNPDPKSRRPQAWIREAQERVRRVESRSGQEALGRREGGAIQKGPVENGRGPASSNGSEAPRNRGCITGEAFESLRGVSPYLRPYTQADFHSSSHLQEYTHPGRWRKCGVGVDGLLHGAPSDLNFQYLTGSSVNSYKYFQKAHELQVSKIMVYVLRTFISRQTGIPFRPLSPLRSGPNEMKPPPRKRLPLRQPLVKEGEIWKGGCAQAYVVDVGSNSGFYSLLGAVLGFHALSIDPQPMCSAQRAALAWANNVTHLIHIFENAISLRPQQYRPGPKCSPKFDTKLAFPEEEERTTVPLDPIVERLNGQILFLKIDTEGAESDVLSSLQGSLSRGLVDNILLEIATISWTGEWGMGVRPFEDLVYKHGYQAVLMELVRLAPRTFRYPSSLRRNLVRIPAFTHVDLAYLLEKGQVAEAIQYHNKTNSFGHIWFTRNLEYEPVPESERPRLYEEWHARSR